MSMGNYLPVCPLRRLVMATDQPDGVIDDSASGQEPTPDPVPGLAHLTVVPANAERPR